MAGIPPLEGHAYEQWLAEALAIANHNCEAVASCVDHTVPGSLVDLMGGLWLSPGSDNLEWAQWLSELAYSIPPSCLVERIMASAHVQAPISQLMATVVLKNIWKKV